MLAGNADRERTLDVLRAAYAEGRLTKDEYDHRAERVLASRTIEELRHLSSDVPHGPGGVSAVPDLSAMAPQPRPYPPPYPSGGRVPYRMPPPVPPVPLAPSNGTAMGALVCGLLAPVTMGVTGVPAVVLGHKARAEIRRSGERGDGWAVAGLTLGWIGVCFFVFFVVMGVVA